MAGDPPRKPFRDLVPSAPGVPGVHLPPFPSKAPPSDRDEYLLQVLAEQTTHIVGKFEALRLENKGQFDGFDRRLLELEKSQLEDARMRLAVQTLIAKVDIVINNERSQDQDIGALKDRVAIAIAPRVEAAASAEGQLSGKAAGNRQGKVWGVVTVLVGIVVSATMQHCQQQIAAYTAGTAGTAPAAPAGH